jgi:hypothetical protein
MKIFKEYLGDLKKLTGKGDGVKNFSCFIIKSVIDSYYNTTISKDIDLNLDNISDPIQKFYKSAQSIFLDPNFSNNYGNHQSKSDEIMLFVESNNKIAVYLKRSKDFMDLNVNLRLNPDILESLDKFQEKREKMEQKLENQITNELTWLFWGKYFPKDSHVTTLDLFTKMEFFINEIFKINFDEYHKNIMESMYKGGAGFSLENINRFFEIHQSVENFNTFFHEKIFAIEAIIDKKDKEIKKNLKYIKLKLIEVQYESSNPSKDKELLEGGLVITYSSLGKIIL